MKSEIRISEAELEVMQQLWSAGEELPASKLIALLGERCGWDGSTTKTLLRRLCQKGAVAAQKRGVYFYSPLITESEYNALRTDMLIQRLYGGNARNLIAALVSDNRITPDDIEQIRRMFRVDD